MQDRILRLKQVCKLTGLSKSTLYELVRTGDFPAPVKIHGRCSGWSANAVQGWIDGTLGDQARDAATPLQVLVVHAPGLRSLEPGSVYRFDCKHCGGDQSADVRVVQDGDLVITCQSGCSNGDILGAMNLSASDLYSAIAIERHKNGGDDDYYR